MLLPRTYLRKISALGSTYSFIPFATPLRLRDCIRIYLQIQWNFWSNFLIVSSNLHWDATTFWWYSLQSPIVSFIVWMVLYQRGCHLSFWSDSWLVLHLLHLACSIIGSQNYSTSHGTFGRSFPTGMSSFSNSIFDPSFHWYYTLMHIPICNLYSFYCQHCLSLVQLNACRYLKHLEAHLYPHSSALIQVIF